MKQTQAGATFGDCEGIVPPHLTVMVDLTAEDATALVRRIGEVYPGAVAAVAREMNLLADGKPLPQPREADCGENMMNDRGVEARPGRGIGHWHTMLATVWVPEGIDCPDDELQFVNGRIVDENPAIRDGMLSPFEVNLGPTLAPAFRGGSGFDDPELAELCDLHCADPEATSCECCSPSLHAHECCACDGQREVRDE